MSQQNEAVVDVAAAASAQPGTAEVPAPAATAPTLAAVDTHAVSKEQPLATATPTHTAAPVAIVEVTQSPLMLEQLADQETKASRSQKQGPADAHKIPQSTARATAAVKSAHTCVLLLLCLYAGQGDC